MTQPKTDAQIEAKAREYAESDDATWHHCSPKQTAEVGYLAGWKAGVEAAGALVKAAQDLLRNYEKCNQYPENVTLHERQLKPLRDAMLALLSDGKGPGEA